MINRITLASGNACGAARVESLKGSLVMHGYVILTFKWI